MNSKSVLVICVVFAAVLGYSIAWVMQTYPVFAPGTHQTIANHVTVHDVDLNKDLTLKFMGSAVFIPGLSAGQFPPGHTYTSSLWAFCFEGNTQIYMKITGPGLDGNTYGLEFSKCAWDELTVDTPGGTFSIAKATATNTVNPGYLTIEFIPDFS